MLKIWVWRTGLKTKVSCSQKNWTIASRFQGKAKIKVCCDSGDYLFPAKIILLNQLLTAEFTPFLLTFLSAADHFLVSKTN